MNGPSHSRLTDLALLVVLCFVAFGVYLGSLGLIDPDEPFYAQTAREMLARHDLLVPHIFGAPQFEKPIFYYWLTIASYATFGVSEFTGRLAPALFGTATVLVTYAWCTRAFSRRVGLCAGLVLATGVLWLFCCRIMLTDIVFAAFASAALYAWWLAREPGSARRGWTIAFFAASGLAVLTKGPLGTIVPLLAVVSFRWRAKERSPLTLRDVCLGVLVYAVIVVPWYAYMLARFGREYFDAFFVHENLDRLLHAEHPSNNHFWFYAAILFGGALPWMPIVALTVARGIRERKRTTPVRRFVWCWLLSSFVFLTIAQSKLPSYALFLFVPLAILCGETIDEVIERGFANSLERWLTLGVGIVQASALFTAGIWVPAARELRVPALCAALLLVAALALSWRKRPTFTALVLPALCPLLLIVTGCAWHIDAIEELTSVRGAVAQVMRERRPGEPLVSDKLLVRGVTYYSQEEVTLLAGDAQPFWSPHALRILVGTEDMRGFVREHGSAYCILRDREWKMATASQENATAADSHYVGTRHVGRITSTTSTSDR